MFDFDSALADVRAERVAKDKQVKELADNRERVLAGLAQNIDAFRDKYNIPVDVTRQDGAVRVTFQNRLGLELKYMNDGTFTASKSASAMQSGNGPRVTGDLDEKAVTKYIVQWLVDTHEKSQ